MNKARLIWIALEYSASPKDGGGVLECEMRATDLQGRRTYGGIHILANPSTDYKHTQPNRETARRHREDGLMEECYGQGIDFKAEGILRTAQWIDNQAKQSELCPVGSDIIESVWILSQYLVKPAMQLKNGCLDMKSIMTMMLEANPELVSQLQQGIPYPGTRTMTRLNAEITFFARIMNEINGIA